MRSNCFSTWLSKWFVIGSSVCEPQSHAQYCFNRNARALTTPHTFSRRSSNCTYCRIAAR